MAIVSDEGVYHFAVNIVMNAPGTFDDMFPMLGMFHFAEVLLRCAGKYLCGSGMDDALIESEVFGPKTLSTVLSGGPSKACLFYKKSSIVSCGVPSDVQCP